MMEWFAVLTQPRGEQRALFNLERQGYRAYLPRYLKRRAHARRVEHVPVPLFPRYLFVLLDTSVQGWRAIRSTFGVSDIVCNGDRPATVSDYIIGELRSRENSDGLVELGMPFKPGEKVEVVDGVFAGLKALFECPCDRERAILLADLLGRQVRLKIPYTAMAGCS